MGIEHSAVQVRVGQGVLWIDDEAYPLRNISHVGQRALEVDKGAAWKKCIKRVLLGLVFGGIVAVGSKAVGIPIVLVVVAVSIWRLMATIAIPPVYGLVLNTAGTQRDAVWSTKASEIKALVQKVTEAISRPDMAQMTFNVQHAVQGDLIQQYGDGNIGKAETRTGNIRGR